MGHRGPEARTEEQGRAPHLPGRGRASIRTTASRPRAAPGAALGWQLSAASSPTLSPVSAWGETLTLQELHSCPWPGLNVLPALLRKAFLFPRTGSESPASTKHLQALTACCWAALPRKRSASRRFRPGCFTCL